MTDQSTSKSMNQSGETAALTVGVLQAAAWFASEKNPPHPIIPELRSRFGLSAAEAVRAINEANLIKARAV